MAVQGEAIAKAIVVNIQDDGSIPIPKELLELVGLQPKDKVFVFEEDGHLVIMPFQQQLAKQLADEIVKSLQAAFKGVDPKELIRELEELRREEECKDDPKRL